jgi:biopolymer transport protein ExbB
MNYATILTLILVFLTAGPLSAGDMRLLQRQAEDQRLELQQQVQAEQQQALKEKRLSDEQIFSDSQRLNEQLALLEQQLGQLQQSLTTLEGESAELKVRERELEGKLTVAAGVVEEVVASIRTNAEESKGMLAEGVYSRVDAADHELLAQLSDGSYIPTMADIRQLVDLNFALLQSSGEVALQEMSIIDRSGRERSAEVLSIGPFTAFYRFADEIGFLATGAESTAPVALSRRPSGRQQRQIRAYLSGAAEGLPIDISGGAALSQLVYQPSLWQQIARGGMLVWPILLVLLLGALIAAERALFLLRRRFNGERLLQQLEPLICGNDWPGCQQLCGAQLSKPLARVVAAGLKSRSAKREELEDVLQEAILREIPAQERFLALLGMFATIAPLLGLLGTVTGMIDTFQVMTLFGTGDPQMMSGGITVALVTTMLGLAVAIPLMLVHTLIGRAVDNNIAQLEEKAIAFVNILQQAR